MVVLIVICLIGWTVYTGYHLWQQATPVQANASVPSDLNVAHEHPLRTFTLNGTPISLEIVTSTDDMAEGLGDRTSLPARHGMLFVYDHPVLAPFWMRHMHFPLDIIWINQNAVVDIGANLPPPKTVDETPVTFTPNGSATWVLEVNAGEASAYGLTSGARVDLTPAL